MSTKESNLMRHIPTIAVIATIITVAIVAVAFTKDADAAAGPKLYMVEIEGQTKVAARKLTPKNGRGDNYVIGKCIRDRAERNGSCRWERFQRTPEGTMRTVFRTYVTKYRKKGYSYGISRQTKALVGPVPAS